MQGFLEGYQIGGGGLSNSPLFNFCLFRVVTPTGGLEVPRVLIFVGKKIIINKIPDLLTKVERKHQKIGCKCIVLVELYYSTLKSLFNCCLEEAAI